MAKVFVSYKEKDRDYREAFEGLMQNPNAKFNHTPISAREDYRIYGYDEVRKYLNELINPCRALVCLLGQNTFQSEWVDHELSVASSLHIGIAAIVVTPNRFVPPHLISTKSIPIFQWDRINIRRALTHAFQYTAYHE
ncbi:MAG: TIR domain-containing protein [Promethearchaeota archaeon]